MSISPPVEPREVPAATDGFDVLDACHRQTLFTLGKFAALVTRLARQGLDVQGRTMAAEISRYFSTVAREHHADEERHLFPRLAASGDPRIVQAVLKLQRDHDWLEEEWMELSTQVDALAAGHPWYDLDLLREGVEVFSALSHEHIALEESCIYPEARARLDAAERSAMAREMAARRAAARAAARCG